MIKDKVKVLGDERRRVKLYMPDGFTTQQTIDEAGVENTQRRVLLGRRRARRTSSPGRPQEFITEFEPTLGGEPVDPYAIYGAQAAQVLLDAIANSDVHAAGRHRRDVRHARCTGGFLGDFTFNENGDPALASGAVVGFTIYGARRSSFRDRLLPGGGGRRRCEGQLTTYG